MLKVCNDLFSVFFCVPFMEWINCFAKKSSAHLLLFFLPDVLWFNFLTNNLFIVFSNVLWSFFDAHLSLPIVLPDCTLPLLLNRLTNKFLFYVESACDNTISKRVGTKFVVRQLEVTKFWNPSSSAWERERERERTREGEGWEIDAQTKKLRERHRDR